MALSLTIEKVDNVKIAVLPILQRTAGAPWIVFGCHINAAEQQRMLNFELVVSNQLFSVTTSKFSALCCLAASRWRPNTVLVSYPSQKIYILTHICLEVLLSWLQKNVAIYPLFANVFFGWRKCSRKKIRESSWEEKSGQNVIRVLETDSIKKYTEHPLFANTQ